MDVNPEPCPGVRDPPSPGNEQTAAEHRALRSSVHGTRPRKRFTTENTLRDVAPTIILIAFIVR